MYSVLLLHGRFPAGQQAPIMIGCDLSMPLCKSALPLFLNKEMLAVSQDDLGVQVRPSRIRTREATQCSSRIVH